MNLPKTILFSIDRTLIDRARLKTFTRRNGAVAECYEFAMHHTPNGKYGDYLVKQQVTKEERAARVEMPILGNGKVFGMDDRAPSQPTQPEPTQGDDVPF